MIPFANLLERLVFTPAGSVPVIPAKAGIHSYSSFPRGPSAP
jgi:hypothetical protein